MPPNTAVKDSRSLRTREAIIRAAEQLFAEHGIAGTSVNTITRLAEQSNRNAVQYHFGDKYGLLQAIFDKHSPGIAERRARLINKLEAENIDGARLIARAIVDPLVEKLDDDDGGEAFIHIAAELISSNTLGYILPEKHPLQLIREPKLAQLASAYLDRLPREIGRQRVLQINGLAFHGLSDHARLRRMTDYHTLTADTAFMASNVIDSMCAILEAPPSPDTRSLLRNRADGPAI